MNTTGSTDQHAPDRAEIEADIAATRAELGDTVASLGHKLDLRARAKHGAAEAGHRARQEVAARASAAVERTRSRPALPVGVVLGVALVGVGVLLWRRRR